MRKLVWWLRSMFCKHEWLPAERLEIHSGPPYMVNPHPTAADFRFTGHMVTRECKRCGWRWTQRTKV